MRYLPLLLLTACATLNQPKPVGQPGPLACISAQSAELAWTEVDKYIREVLAAQVAYSCAPIAPPAPPAVAPLR